MKQLTALGHKFTIVSFGVPNKTRRAAISDHSAGVKSVEVVALFEQWLQFAPALEDLRQSGDFEVYLNAVRPEVEGWTTHHDMRTDLIDELSWVLDQTDLSTAVDGFVFGIRRDVAPFEGFRAVQDCLAGTGYKPAFHIPTVGMYWSTKDNEQLSEIAEMSRNAETTMLARAYPDLSFVIDNFVELDRGYWGCQGLVDRFYDPKDGSRVTTSLNSLLPRHLKNMESQETSAGRLLWAEHDGGTVVMLCAAQSPSPDTLNDQIPDRLSNKAGKLIELTNGEETSTSLADVMSNRKQADGPRPPVLLNLAH